MKKIFMLIMALCSIVGARAQECVDLGLSVNWANANVGAQSEEKIGAYFYPGSNIEINKEAMHKYKKRDFPQLFSEYSGNPEMDPATSRLGSNWRTPTYNEWQELINECSWRFVEYIDSDSKKCYGYEVTGPNGNKIIIPSNVMGNLGYYQCSTPSSNFKKVYILAFNHSKKVLWQYKYNPYFIISSCRPVYDKKENTHYNVDKEDVNESHSYAEIAETEINAERQIVEFPIRNNDSANNTIQNTQSIQSYTSYYSTKKTNKEVEGYIQTGVLFDSISAGPILEVSIGGRFYEHVYLGFVWGAHTSFAKLPYNDKVTEMCYLPLGANLRFYMTKKSNTKVVPFIEGSLGLGIGVGNTMEEYFGFWCQAGAGIDVERFSFSIGYNGLVNGGSINFGYIKVGVRLGN